MQYLGDWYQQMVIPYFFQPAGSYCSHAQYGDNGNACINIILLFKPYIFAQPIDLIFLFSLTHAHIIPSHAGDGTVSVYNTEIRESGEYEEACGTAVQVDPEYPGELAVGFPARKLIES